MNLQLQAEIVKLGGDPSDSTWQWFVINGPHGPYFHLGATRREPAGRVGVELLREFVAERASFDPEFGQRIKEVVHGALASESVQLLRRAIQVAAVVGGATELDRIAALTRHADGNVAADARACVFVLSRGAEPRQQS